jgi:capsid protein
MSGASLILGPDGRPARQIDAVRAYYEAARWTPSRSQPLTSYADARNDISRWSRSRIASKARYLEANSPTFDGLATRLADLVVSTGITPTPATSSKRFNAAAAEYWRQWSGDCELTGALDFGGLLWLAYRRGPVIDGDCGILLTWGDDNTPKLQIIESHRLAGDSPKPDFDGVTLDALGRPLSYTITTTAADNSTSTITVPASSLLLCMLPTRAHQARGMSMFASAIHEFEDVDDILALEKAAVKKASSQVDVIYSQQNPEENPTAFGIGKSVRTLSDGTQRVEYYKQVTGTETKVLMPEDRYQIVESNRPSNAWAGFMDFLDKTVCRPSGISANVLLDLKVGGADTRKDVAQARRTIARHQAMLVRKAQAIYEYALGWAIDKGLVSNAPLEWQRCEWHMPPDLTVDAGRDSQADREDVKAGLLTRREYWARFGLDWREQTEQKAIEAAAINELARRYKVERAEIALLDPNELAVRAANADTQP